MPNSPWTETGSSISLVPSTTTIGSDPENVNYLSNQDKINLMAQYAAELAMKTSLDTLSSTWSVSSTFYDNAVAAISTALINAGAPANWATTWPDGTTSGPWPGIQTSLSNLWAQVATQRTALQSSISAAQAAAAQAAAIAAAATTSLSQMNAAINAAQNLAPVVVSSLPALPNSSYPAARLAWNTADGQLYRSTGSAWVVQTVSASNVFGQITAGQIAAGAIGATQIAANAITTSKLTVANFTNLVPNPNCLITNLPSGSLEAAGLVYVAGYVNQAIGACSNGWVRATNCGTSGTAGFTLAQVTCNPGDVFNAQCLAAFQSSFIGNGYIGLFFLSATGTNLGATGSNLCSGGSSNPTTLSVTATAPAGAAQVVFYVELDSGGSANGMAVNNLILRQCANASVIVDGSITASKIAAGAITADMIITGTLNAANVAVTNLNASNITAGTLSASKVLFADGSTLTTASRVQTSTLSETSTATTSGVGTPGTAIPGLSGSVTVASSADVFNIFGSISGAQTAGTAGADCYINLCVDGSLNQQALVHFAVLNGTQQAMVIMSLTGLSAGTHTFTFYVASSLSTATFQTYNGTKLMLQRVF